MKKILMSFFCILILVFGITACSRESAYVRNPIVENLSAQERAILANLESSDMQVIKQGMLFTFVIPTDCFFTKTTRELKTHREKELDLLAQFLFNYSRYFLHPKIMVTGYTDKTWNYPARNLLALHYAEIVATYFREDGLASDMIIVTGAGEKNPVASNHYPMGTSFNRRVVVTIQ